MSDSKVDDNNNHHDLLVLPDGRTIAYSQFGSSSGKPVLYMHGHPGSRLEGIHLHDLGLKLRARIIAADRPGFGGSSPHPERTLLDCPKDIERLADHLKLDKYGVMGVSGGGPYALACAFALPKEKLKCVSIICGMGPASEIGMKGARLPNWVAFTFGYRYALRILNQWFWQYQTCGRLDWSDEKRLEEHIKEFSSPQSRADPKDVEVMTDRDNAQRFLRVSRVAFAQGYDATLQDGRVLSADFGFRIQDIRPDLPVQLWYGRQDVNVPLHHGEVIAERLGGGRRVSLHVKDETHASIFFKWREQALEQLVEKI